MSSSEKKSPDLKADRQDESKCFSKERLAELLPDVAHAILGKPNRQLSSGKELRYNTRGSLSIDVPKGTWFDHETKRGGGTLDFIEHHTGCDRAGAFDWLRRNGFDGDQSVNGSGRGRSKLGRIVAEFDYCGPNGELRFQVTKHDPKDFRQRRPDGKGGWIWDLDGVRPVPYRLPELIKAVANERVVAVPEGEKDCNKLWDIGIAATTNAGGAGNWKAELNEHFRGADVVIIPDNDDAGRKHASVVAAQLKSIAKRIRILELWRHWPGMPVKGDVSDWLEKGGGTREKLDALIDAAPVFVAEASADEVPVTPIDLWGHLNPPELPRGLLPVKVEQFAVEQGGVMGVDPGGLAAAALVVCAAAIPDSIELQVKKHERGWTESARLWAALVGMPSTKKTPTMREAVRPLTKLDAAYARDYAAAKQVYDALPPDQRKSATKPVRKQLKLEDTSIEAAQEVLRDNPSGALCLADELSGWFGSMDKYNSGGRGAAKDRGFWLQSWNGGSHSVNRINRGSFLIENLSVSVLGGIQPDLIRKTVDEAHDDGLIQRLLPIVVRPGAAGRDEPTHEVVASYARLIGNLHELEPKFAAGWDNVGGQAIKLELDDDAQAIRRELEQKHLELMGLEVINKKLAAHVGKYDAFFARLCVVFHCVEYVSGSGSTDLPCTITADTAGRAAKFLHQFLLRHAAAFYAGILHLSDDHDRLAAVAGYILAHKLDRVTNRDVQRGDQTMRKLTRWDTERVFEQLEAMGWVFRRPAPRPTDPPHWQVNPEVHRLFTERAEQEATRRAKVRDLFAQLAG